MLDVGQFVGGDRKFGHVEPVGGFEHDLPFGPRRIARQTCDQIVRRITEFADVKVVESWIVVGAGADRRATERDRQIERVGTVADVVHLLALDVHAADEHGFGPFEILVRGGADVLVDETDFPVGREIGRDQQKSLRRHEGLHTTSQGIGVLKRAKRGRVAGKDAKNAPNAILTHAPHRTFPRTPSCKCTSSKNPYKLLELAMVPGGANECAARNVSDNFFNNVTKLKRPRLAY